MSLYHYKAKFGEKQEKIAIKSEKTRKKIVFINKQKKSIDENNGKERGCRIFSRGKNSTKMNKKVNIV